MSSTVARRKTHETCFRCKFAFEISKMIKAEYVFDENSREVIGTKQSGNIGATVGGAVIGGILTGGVGALVGAVAGSNKSRTNENMYSNSIKKVTRTVYLCKPCNKIEIEEQKRMVEEYNKKLQAQIEEQKQIANEENERLLAMDKMKSERKEIMDKLLAEVYKFNNRNKKKWKTCYILIIIGYISSFVLLTTVVILVDNNLVDIWLISIPSILFALTILLTIIGKIKFKVSTDYEFFDKNILIKKYEQIKLKNTKQGESND